MAGQITIDQLPVGGAIADDDSFISVQTYNGARRTTRLPGASIKSQLKGDTGQPGLPPAVSMIGDQVAINGQPIGPHLTGPQGPEGSGMAANGYLVKNISAGFYYPSAEDVFTILLNTYNIGGTGGGVTGPNDCVCYLPTTNDAALPIGSEIQLVDENVADGSVTYFMAINGSVLHTLDGAGMNVACAKSWDPIRAVKVSDKDWIIFGDTVSVTPPTPLTPSVVTSVVPNTVAKTFAVNWGTVDANTTSQVVSMNIAGTSTVLGSATVIAAARTATITPTAYSTNVQWQPFDFFVTSYSTGGKTPAISNKLQAYAGYPSLVQQVTAARVIPAEVSASGKIEVTVSTSYLGGSQTDAINQGVNKLTLTLINNTVDHGSKTISVDYTAAYTGQVLTGYTFKIDPATNFFQAGQQYSAAIVLSNNYGSNVGSPFYSGTIASYSAPISKPDIASAKLSWSLKTLTLTFNSPWVYDAKDVIQFLSATIGGYVVPSQFTVTSYTVSPSGSTSYVFSNCQIPTDWNKGASAYAWMALNVGNDVGTEIVTSLFTVNMVA